MAISPENIRKITIQVSTQGIDEATAALNKLAEAQDRVAASTQRMLTASEALARQKSALKK